MANFKEDPVESLTISELNVLKGIGRSVRQNGGPVDIPFEIVAQWIDPSRSSRPSKVEALNIIRSLIRQKYIKGYIDWEVIHQAELLAEIDMQTDIESARSGNRNIFVVHGHDGHLKEAVARLIERLGFNAVIIAERPSAGRTIIEQVEKYSNVQYAVVLLTPDDLPSGSGSEYARARQNVVFELGFFVGRLGRSKVHCLRKGKTQLFSDIDGVIWTPVDDAGMDWRVRLAQEMSAAGLPVDLNKVFSTQE
jgi:predicted nucleotide-binding protein